VNTYKYKYKYKYFSRRIPAALKKVCLSYKPFSWNNSSFIRYATQIPKYTRLAKCRTLQFHGKWCALQVVAFQSVI